MRIGIDARFFGVKQKGLGRYSQELIENLEKIVSPDDFEFLIFLRKENFHQYQPKNPSFKKVLADYRWYTLAEQIFMPSKIRQEKIDLMHFLHFNVPFFYQGEFVVTIHDLVLKEFPTQRATTLHPLIYKLKEQGYKIVIKNALKNSEKIIVPSQATKNEILKYFKTEPEKIRVVYEGTSQMEIPNHKSQITNKFQIPNSKYQNKILKKYRINRPYLLYVGSAYPHKNLENLILAFDLLRKENFGYQLVLVGELDYFYKRLMSSIKYQVLSIKYHSDIIFTDFIPDSDLSQLYQNASMSVFPSFSEGFGLPPTEAMSFGVPVVVSDIPVFREILGEAVLFFNPKNQKDIASKIKKVLEDEKIKNNLIEKGFSQIQKYSWQKMSQEILKIYKEILS